MNVYWVPALLQALFSMPEYTGEENTGKTPASLEYVHSRLGKQAKKQYTIINKCIM